MKLFLKLVFLAVVLISLMNIPNVLASRALISAVPKLVAAAGLRVEEGARHQMQDRLDEARSSTCMVSTRLTIHDEGNGGQWNDATDAYQVYDLVVENLGDVVVTDVQLTIALHPAASFGQFWGMKPNRGSSKTFKLANHGGIQAGASQAGGFVVRLPLNVRAGEPVVEVDYVMCADGNMQRPVASPSPSPEPTPALVVPSNAECQPTYYTEAYWRANGGLSPYFIGSWKGVGTFSIVNKTTGVMLQTFTVNDTWTVVYNKTTGGLYWIDNFIIVGDLSPGPANYFNRFLQGPGRTCTHQKETPIDNNVGKEYDFEDSLQISTLVDRNTGDLTMSCSYKYEPNDWTRVQVDCALYDNMVNYVPAGTLVQYHIYMFKQQLPK